MNLISVKLKKHTLLVLKKRHSKVVLDHLVVNATVSCRVKYLRGFLQSLAAWISNILPKIEDRGFMTKETLKYINSSDLDVLFPSPLKLSYAKKKILLKETEQLSNKDITQKPFGGTKTQSAAHIADSAELSTSFLAKKEERFSDDIQFLEERIASAKQEYTWLQQQAGDRLQQQAGEGRAPKQAKTCSICHLTGHQKRHCKNPTCPGISQCSLQCKHLEIKAEIAELQGLIKDLEKGLKNQRANS